MLSYLVQSLASTILVMTLVGIFVFLLLHLSAGDPAAIIAGAYATPQQIVAIRQRLGLDDPLLVQFGRWGLRVIQGDLGVSIFSSTPVSTLILQRLEPTLSLAVLTLSLRHIEMCRRDRFKGAPNIEKAKQLVKESGYDGRPVVVLQATNIAYMNNAANLIAQWMRQAGFNVSLQASDWGAVVTLSLIHI